MGSYKKAPPSGKSLCCKQQERAVKRFFYNPSPSCRFATIHLSPWARRRDKQTEASSGCYAATFPQGEGFKKLPIIAVGNNLRLYGACSPKNIT